MDGAPAPADRGRADLRQFDGDARFSAAEGSSLSDLVSLSHGSFSYPPTNEVQYRATHMWVTVTDASGSWLRPVTRVRAGVLVTGWLSGDVAACDGGTLSFNADV